MSTGDTVATEGPPTTHLRLDLAYDGTDFSGWATQPGLRTVQEVVESAIETVLRLPHGACRLTVAGRTDAGVHARRQVCDLHVPAGATDPADPADLANAVDPALLRMRLNRLLPADVVVRRIAAAPEGFDARFSASWRRYTYRIYDRPEAVDPLRRRDVLRWPRPLDERAMNEAAMDLLGEDDFAAFCKRRDGASTVRDLHELSWAREGDLLQCRVLADAFCHHLVRSLVGCLLAVGEGRQPTSWPAEVLAARVRDPRVTVVPALGLTLEEVGYPPDGELAARAIQTRAGRLPAGGGPGPEEREDVGRR